LISRRANKQDGISIPAPGSATLWGGTAEYQIEGQPAQLLPTGSAFHEPAGKVIASFSNASKTAPMSFGAFYLLDGEQERITMLENHEGGETCRAKFYGVTPKRSAFSCKRNFLELTR
jgi:hypothetical protein